MAQKKNQHWIPQGYLRGFTIEGEKSLIWKYDKTKGTVSKFPVSVRKICSQNYYYSQKDENGRDDHVRMENGLEKIESVAARIIAKIEPGKSSQKINLNGEDRGALAFFIGLLLTRGPNFRDRANDVYKQAVEISFRILYENGQLPEPPEIVKKLIAEKGVNTVIEADVFPQVSLGPMIQLAEQMGRALLGKVWTYHTPAGGMVFVTSDNPVHFCLPEKYPKMPIGPAHPLSEITIPLRKDLALICVPGITLSREKFLQLDGHFTKPDKDETLKINIHTVSSARQCIYSSDRSDDLLNTVKKLECTTQCFRTTKNTGRNYITSQWL